jgi:hypothetical protein
MLQRLLKGQCQGVKKRVAKAVVCKPLTTAVASGLKGVSKKGPFFTVIRDVPVASGPKPT